MKTFLLKLLGRVANAFREADYTQGRDAYLRSYGASRTLMVERRATPLPIGHDNAMQLRARPAFFSHTGVYVAFVEETVTGRTFYAVYGDTPATVDARAAQLVSALDGARRL